MGFKHIPKIFMPVYTTSLPRAESVVLHEVMFVTLCYQKSCLIIIRLYVCVESMDIIYPRSNIMSILWDHMMHCLVELECIKPFY